MLVFCVVGCVSKEGCMNLGNVLSPELPRLATGLTISA